MRNCIKEQTDSGITSTMFESLTIEQEWSGDTKRMRVGGASREELFDRLNRLLDERRLTTGSMLVWMNALEAQPHVCVVPVGEREEANEQQNIMNSLYEAGSQARQNYDQTFCKSKYERARGMNSAAIEGEIYGQDPKPDHCAICAVLKEQCTEQATHFGDRGESPPDSVCVDCGQGFGNTYWSAKDLALHRSAYRKSYDSCKTEDFETNRRHRMREPLYDAAELAAFERDKQEMEARDKLSKKSRASKKQKK